MKYTYYNGMYITNCTIYFTHNDIDTYFGKIFGDC